MNKFEFTEFYLRFSILSGPLVFPRQDGMCICECQRRFLFSLSFEPTVRLEMRTKKKGRDSSAGSSKQPIFSDRSILLSTMILLDRKRLAELMEASINRMI